MRACLNIRVPHVRWALELQLIVSCHAGAGIGCSFSEPTPEQVLRQVRSLSLPATPLVGFHWWGSTRLLQHTPPFLARALKAQAFSSCPSSRPLLSQGCVWLQDKRPLAVPLTLGDWAGQLETGRQWEAWAGRNAASARNADINLSNSSGQQVLPPRLLAPPQPPPPVPWCFKKTQRKRRAGLENNICWILNIWMKLTKKIMNTHSGWGDIRVEVILLRS